MAIDFKLWLLARYDVDAKARNQTLLSEVLKRLPAKETLKITDLGAGMGSNFRFLHPLIDHHQQWTLLDIDKDLLESVPKFLSKKLKKEIVPGQAIHLDEKEIVLDTQLMDLLDASNEKISADVIVSNAVFDLFSEARFDQLVQRLNAPLVYFTISYKGTTFSPSTSIDEKYLKLYDLHMQRDQAFGKGMGPRCAERMVDILKKHQFDVQCGPSDWLLDANDREVQHYLVRFIKESVQELLRDDEKPDFQSWIKNVNERIDFGELFIRVEHEDIMAGRSLSH